MKYFGFFKFSVLVKLLILPGATAILLVMVWMYKLVTLFAVELEQSPSPKLSMAHTSSTSCCSLLRLCTSFCYLKAR